MQFIFIDTNLFLQCKDLGELPWSDLFNDESIILLIPRAVQIEIDKQKSNGNNRRAKKARSTNTLFKKILNCVDETLIIKENSPSIKITFSPKIKYIDPPEEYFLNKNDPDDSIILEILSYKDKFPERKICLLTHDTNPLLTAKQLKIDSQGIPDNWLLAIESSDKDKKISRLEKQIDELLGNSPIVEVQALKDGEVITSDYNEVFTFSSLSKKEITSIVSDLKTKFPMKTDFDFDSDRQDIHSIVLGRAAVKPSSSEINKYLNEDYPEWINKVHITLADIHNRLFYDKNKYFIIYNLVNVGTVPVKNIIIEFSVTDNLDLVPSSNDNQDELCLLEIPQAPKPPKSSMFSTLSAIAKLNFDQPLRISPTFMGNNKRDRNSFYWKDSKPITLVKSYKFECKEFLHKVKVETFNVTYMVRNDKIPERGRINCVISGANLPFPKELTLDINFSTIEGDTFLEAKKAFGLV